MWYLVSSNKADERHVFICEKEYVFGRKDCDVVLSGDPAVSRRHASIQISHSDINVANPNKLPLILLKDLSKFGTWVSGKKVDGEIQLKNGDKIFFGSPKSSYLVVYEPFIVTSSCLDAQSKRLTRRLARKVGGYVVNEWCKDCSLLVMNSISVTIKVVCALVSQKHIVSPKYLEDYVQHLQNNGEKPDANKYLPSVVESQINSDTVSFLPDLRRQTLFQGMKFIFLSAKQFKKMFMAIELAGGSAVLIEEKPSDFNEDILVEEGTVVMALTEDTNTLDKNMKDWYRCVTKALKKKNKKLIPDSEIGYSVLFCSKESHCNPDMNNDSSQQVLPDIKSQSLATEITFETPDILAMDTEPSQQGKCRRPQIVGTPGGRKVVDETFFSKHVKKEQTASTVTEQGPSKDNRPTEGPQVEEKGAQEVIEIKEEPVTPKSKPSKISAPLLIKTEPLSPAVPATETKKSPDKPTENLVVRKRTRSPSPADKQGEAEKRYRFNIEEEIKAEEVHGDVEEVIDEPLNDVTAPQALPDGFLTTRKPIKSQVVKSERYTLESDLPERCVVTTFVDLVSRPLVKTSTTRGEAVPEGYVKWKGRLVKNFKKFKKVRNAGSNALPNIIGGSDLQVHVAERSSELENWLQQSIQAESQLNEEEREAQELFNFNPKNSKKKTR